MVEEDTTCPTCERDDFETEKGMKIHHTLKHRESISGFEFVCDACGNTMYDEENKEQKYHFCDRDCYDDWATKEKITLVCNECSENFDVHECESHRKFCTDECYWDSLNGITGEDHPRWVDRIEKVCNYCEEDFKVRPCEEYRQHCSRECMANTYSEERSGDFFSWWRGGSIHTDQYGVEWIEAREKALYRDDYLCTDCEMSNKVHNNTYNKNLEVHHIVPVRTFKDYTAAHELTNLRTLCVPCHRRIETELRNKNV